MDPQTQPAEDEVYCTACRTPYRQSPETPMRGCPACGHTAWIAAAFIHQRARAEGEQSAT
jgi:predicted  nucleic acid-binding Zn-ribbon protein